MTKSSHLPLVEVTRGNLVESVHRGSCAILLPNGNPILTLGDMEDSFFLRSTAKPFQTLAFLERGGAKAYGLTQEEIAILCSSHSGTERHLAVLKQLQKKVGIREDMLQCGIHEPLHAETAKELVKKGKALSPNHNNCSGKHSGMLAFAKMIAAPLDTYLEPEHPVQQAILETFAEMCAVDIESVALGTDGCTAPVFAVPLARAAHAYARLCQPEGLPAERAAACRRITGAMASHPFLVAGPERFDTDAMQTARGAIICKVGAEGYQGIGILPGRARNFPTGIGIAFKVSDGDPKQRATGVIAMAILKALGVLDPEGMNALQRYGRRPIANWREKTVGEIRPSQELSEALKTLQ